MIQLRKFLFLMLTVPSFASGSQREDVCESLDRMGLIGLKLPILETLVDSIRYRLDKKRFAKWIFFDGQNSRSNPSTEVIESDESRSSARFLIVSLIPHTEEPSSEQMNLLRRRFRNALDPKLLRIIRSPDIATCKQNVEQIGTEAAAEALGASLRRLETAMKENKVVSDFYVRRDLEKLRLVTEGKSSSSISTQVYMNSDLASLLNRIRTASSPTYLVIVAHASLSGAVRDINGLELPPDILREASPNIRGVFFATCEGEAVFKKYNLRRWSTASEPRWFGYITTGDIGGNDVKLSSKALIPVLTDLQKRLAKVKQSPAVRNLSPQCFLEPSSQPSDSFVLFSSTRRLLGVIAGTREKSQPYGFPCELLEGSDYLRISRSNLDAIAPAELPHSIAIHGAESGFTSVWQKELSQITKTSKAEWIYRYLGPKGLIR